MQHALASPSLIHSSVGVLSSHNPTVLVSCLQSEVCVSDTSKLVFLQLTLLNWEIKQ